MKIIMHSEEINNVFKGGIEEKLQIYNSSSSAYVKTFIQILFFVLTSIIHGLNKWSNQVSKRRSQFF